MGRRFVICAGFALIAAACSSAPPVDSLPDIVDAPPERTRPNDSPEQTQDPTLPREDPLSPTPTPAPACTDECENENERRCKATASFESCLRGANGCLGWVESACANGASCDAEAPAACFGECPPAGKEACSQIDAKRCTGTTLQQCTAEAGCLVWKTVKDCASSSQICDGSACVTQCTSNCTTANARRCVAGTNNFETCKEVQPGCFKWQGATGCGTGKVCTGEGQCTCSHQCSTVGQDQCVSPDTFKTCTTNAAGCRVWSSTKGCVRSVPSPGCFAYPKACFGDCNDTCTTEGQITCTGSTSYVKCVRNSEQCLVSTSGSCKTSTICFASPTLCANGN